MATAELRILIPAQTVRLHPRVLRAPPYGTRPRRPICVHARPRRRWRLPIAPQGSSSKPNYSATHNVICPEPSPARPNIWQPTAQSWHRAASNYDHESTHELCPSGPFSIGNVADLSDGSVASTGTLHVRIYPWKRFCSNRIQSESFWVGGGPLRGCARRSSPSGSAVVRAGAVVPSWMAASALRLVWILYSSSVPRDGDGWRSGGRGSWRKHSAIRTCEGFYWRQQKPNRERHGAEIDQQPEATEDGRKSGTDDGNPFRFIIRYR
jgi:hypothetical protein